MQPDLILRCCIALHSADHWKTATAKDLDVTPATVSRWASGDYPMPASQQTALLAALQRKRDTIDAVINQISVDKT